MRIRKYCHPNKNPLFPLRSQLFIAARGWVYFIPTGKFPRKFSYAAHTVVSPYLIQSRCPVPVRFSRLDSISSRWHYRYAFSGKHCRRMVMRSTIKMVIMAKIRRPGIIHRVVKDARMNILWSADTRWKNTSIIYRKSMYSLSYGKLVFWIYYVQLCVDLYIFVKIRWNVYSIWCTNYIFRRDVVDSFEFIAKNVSCNLKYDSNEINEVFVL